MRFTTILIIYLYLRIFLIFFSSFFIFFFFNDTATTEIYTLSLHDALPIFLVELEGGGQVGAERLLDDDAFPADRKSTRLNSSHVSISYAVFCLKKKKKKIIHKII